MVTITEMCTDRLILREVNPELIDELFGNYADADICDILGFRHPVEWEMFRLRYQRFQLHNHRISYCNWLLADAETGWLIGDCGFHTWWRQDCFAEISFAVWDESLRRQGLATEALAAILPIGFMEFGLERIEAFVNPENEPSIRLLEKFGFVQEARLRNRRYGHDEMEDTLVFALFPETYRPGAAL